MIGSVDPARILSEVNDSVYLIFLGADELFHRAKFGVDIGVPKLHHDCREILLH